MKKKDKITSVARVKHIGRKGKKGRGDPPSSPILYRTLVRPPYPFNRIIFDGRDYLTPRQLYDKGVVTCMECGVLMSLTYKWCKRCGKDGIFILDGGSDDIQPAASQAPL